MTKINHTYLVDDNEFVLLIGEKSITKHPAYDKVSTFGNGKLALESLKNCLVKNEPLPQLIILDINMPEMNGWEFLDAFSLSPELYHIPVYLFTTPVDPEVKEKAGAYKAIRGFLSKSLPFDEIDRLALSFSAGIA